MLAVAGSTGDPSSISVSGDQRLAPGVVLSMAPSPELPTGLLSRVTAVKHHGNSTRLTLAPVSVYSVVPVANFDVPLAPVPQSASGLTYGHLAQPPAFGPVRSNSPVGSTIKNIRFSGGWNTVHVLGQSIPVGAQLRVHFDADGSINKTLGLRPAAEAARWMSRRPEWRVTSLSPPPSSDRRARR